MGKTLMGTIIGAITEAANEQIFGVKEGQKSILCKDVLSGEYFSLRRCWYFPFPRNLTNIFLIEKLS